MKKFLIFILGLFIFSSLVSYSAEVYETASEDFIKQCKNTRDSSTRSGQS